MGSGNKRREVRNVARRYKCDFLILCETKVVALSSPLLRSSGGGRLNNWEILPSQGPSGGILIGWNSSFCDRMESFRGSFFLSVRLLNKMDKFDWWLTGVYGPYVTSMKQSFLEELSHLQSQVSSHWVLGGDFNITRFSHEHSSRTQVSPIMTEFNNFIASASLVDFSPNNCLYTWSNFQVTLTMVKLDIFLVSQGWEAHFPRSICCGKVRIISDHILICLDTQPPGWGPLPFKFYKS